MVDSLFDQHDPSGYPLKGVNSPKVALNDTSCVSLATKRVSLCELLDRVLNKGVVLAGEITISIANIDLIYIGLNLIISSVETILSHLGREGANGNDRN